MKSAHGKAAFDRLDRFTEDGQMRCRKGKPCNGRCIPRSHECANANQAPTTPTLSRSQKIKGLAETVSSVAGAVGGVVAAGGAVAAAGMKVREYSKSNQKGPLPSANPKPVTEPPVQPPARGRSKTRKYRISQFK